MSGSKAIEAKDKAFTLTAIGLIVMVLLSLTQLMPSVRIAGYGVFVGVAMFFIVEAVAKTPKEESGLRFKSFWADLKKPGVILWVLLPIVTAILPLLLDNLLFNNEYSAHVVGRTDGMLSYENIPLMVVEVIVFALGEEIAWRGFFVGKAMKRFPFWLCAVLSSALFAMGHISDGSTALVLFDISFVFIDSLIFTMIYKKSGNCLVSTVSHIIGNAVGIALIAFI